MPPSPAPFPWPSNTYARSFTASTRAALRPRNVRSITPPVMPAATIAHPHATIPSSKTGNVSNPHSAFLAYSRCRRPASNGAPSSTSTRQVNSLAPPPNPQRCNSPPPPIAHAFEIDHIPTPLPSPPPQCTRPAPLSPASSLPAPPPRPGAVVNLQHQSTPVRPAVPARHAHVPNPRPRQIHIHRPNLRHFGRRQLPLMPPVPHERRHRNPRQPRGHGQQHSPYDDRPSPHVRPFYQQQAWPHTISRNELPDLMVGGTLLVQAWSGRQRARFHRGRIQPERR